MYVSIKREIERQSYYTVCFNLIIKKKQKLELASLLSSSADTSLVNTNVKQIKKRDVRNLAIV